jgi:hypothetical protein
MFRLWFCAAVALIAVAIADPAVEYASNAGWFGPGSFTDHSNLDVVPALAAGLLFAGLCLFLRVRAALRTAVPLAAVEAIASSRAWKLVAVTFGLQIAALVALESAEQLIVLGHLGGPTLWAGGPLPISLAVHAVACVLTVLGCARLLRSLERTTLRVLAGHRLAVLARRAPAALAQRAPDWPVVLRSVRALQRIGGRAPPPLPA